MKVSHLTFSGVNGSGTFVMPMLDGTTVSADKNYWIK